MSTPTTDLVESELRAILERAGGDYVAAYDQIVDKVDADAKASRPVINRKARVERFKEAVSKRDRKALAKANKIFSGYLRKVRANAELSENMTEPRQLTLVEATSLMSEMLDIKEGKDTFTAREEEIKRLAFDHLNELFAEQGEQAPHLVNGSIDIPELNYRFSREGAGYSDPTLNEKALKAHVGDAVWDQIVDRETKVVETVNIGKLMAAASSNPALLEDLRRSLKVGEEKPGRLNIRPL